jgi:uncharacterized protein (DUF1499 family)
MIWLRRIVVGLVVLIVSGAVGLFAWAQTAPQPINVSQADGQLAPCPDTPNCVTSRNGTADQQVEALSYTDDLAAAQERLRAAILTLPRTAIVTERPGYIHALYRSPTFGFPDDLEFVFDDANKQVHMRSAARLGRGDQGKNREHITLISAAFR